MITHLFVLLLTISFSVVLLGLIQTLPLRLFASHRPFFLPRVFQAILNVTWVPQVVCFGLQGASLRNRGQGLFVVLIVCVVVLIACVFGLCSACATFLVVSLVFAPV